MKTFLISLILCGVFAVPAFGGNQLRMAPQPHRCPTYIVVPRYKTQKVTTYHFAPPWDPSRPARKTVTYYYRPHGYQPVYRINP